jgi:hypothetical protein
MDAQILVKQIYVQSLLSTSTKFEFVDQVHDALNATIEALNAWFGVKLLILSFLMPFGYLYGRDPYFLIPIGHGCLTVVGSLISYKVETPIHDNNLIWTPIIAPQSG